jgi:hypothetical protein
MQASGWEGREGKQLMLVEAQLLPGRHILWSFV